VRIFAARWCALLPQGGAHFCRKVVRIFAASQFLGEFPLTQMCSGHMMGH
jgi:hypothetical protein